MFDQAEGIDGSEANNCTIYWRASVSCSRRGNNSAAVRGKQTLRRPRQKRGDRPKGDIAPSAVHLAQSASLDGPFLRRACAFIHHFAKRGMRSKPSSACHYARSTAAKNREEHDHRILGSSISLHATKAVSRTEKLQGNTGIAHRDGADVASSRWRDAGEGVRDLSLRSRFRREPPPRYFPRRPRRLRTDGSRCAVLDQEQGGSDRLHSAARAGKASAAPAP